jgi:hypothetical protein
MALVLTGKLLAMRRERSGRMERVTLEIRPTTTTQQDGKTLVVMVEDTDEVPRCRQVVATRPDPIPVVIDWNDSDWLLQFIEDTPIENTVRLAVISRNETDRAMLEVTISNSRHNHGNSQFVPGTSRTLRLYHDQGPEVGLRHPDRWNTGSTDVFFAFGEAAAQRLNREGAGNHVYRFNKLLQLHGGFHWRDCPRCGRIFTTAPNYEDETDGIMLRPSLLPEICRGWKPGKSEEEQHEWRRGRFGSVQCIYCGYTAAT